MTLEEQLKCAKRELAIRQKAYPRWVLSEKMTQQTADHGIAAMKAIVDTLQRLVDMQGRQPDLFAE